MWTKKYCNNTLLQVKKEKQHFDFHLTLVTFLKSFHPHYLVNIKQGQIECQVERTFWRKITW